MKSHRLFVALDVDFLLALADGADSALGTIDTITRIRGFPVVSPAVIQELEWISRYHSEPRARHLADVCLNQMTNWGIVAPPVDGVNQDVVGITARRILDAGICKSFQSASVLIEACILNCPILMTYQDHMHEVDGGELRLIMLGSDLPCDCWPILPDAFVAYFSAPTPAATS